MELIPMASKLGSLSHAKGFIINKLFNQNRIGGSHVQVVMDACGAGPTNTTTKTERINR
jgi:hypothetical protein